MDIKSHIKSEKLSRAEICKETGMTASALSMIVTGSRVIGLDKVEGLAKALGVKPADLRPDLAKIFAPDYKPAPPAEKSDGETAR